VTAALVLRKSILRQGGLIVESLTLVIIEDEESHFDLMKRAIVRKFPYASVYHFQEANTCLERLDEINPTVIIIDYLLPDMNGIEFLEALNQRNIDIPVIMITGHGNENIAVRAMKSGAKDYLVKSGDFFTLLPSIIDNVIRERKLEQSLRKSEDFVHNLFHMLMQAQERERQMISYELHDSIGQNLSTLKIGCDMLFENQPAISPELRGKMAELSKFLEQTITAVRNLAYGLQPPGLDEMGLVKALEMYCEEFYEKNGVKVDFQSAGLHSFDMDSNTEIHIYRLVQEGLNNIRKHADAAQVNIMLMGASPNIILRIEDNGKGFDVKARELALSNEKRLGLRSMKERVNLLQGQMTIKSRPMQGTKIFIKIPFKERKNESEKAHINH
jgi:signal transduction histidine kinase